MVLPVTEDTPPDMLAGSMDLRVVLPSGHALKMSVERSTPMMDLLVQVTTLNKIAPAGHVLQAMGENGILPYKPSTPIGALEAWTIHIVPKNKVQAPIVQKKAPLRPANQQQPFEQTFRLQVHLPRNQLYVMRVSPRTLLCDILQQTCTEKNLDPNKYEMRHPADLSQLLNPSCSLADYGLQEVTVVGKSRGMSQALSTSDIMALQREEDKRRQQARQQQSSAGLSLMFSKRSRSSVCEGSVSSDSLGGRSISPARSDESASRSASPPAPMMAPPTRPARKRRPAPKPPAPPDVQAQKQIAQEEAVNVSHSRNSSDSSGYHEASVLSDGPADLQQIPDTLPRRNKMPAKSQAGLSRSMSSLTAATSTTSLSSAGQKKKKAPPPPPVNKTTSLERHLSGKSSSQPTDKCSTLPGKLKMPEPEHVTNSADIPETSNHREEKLRSSASELLEEKPETLPSSTQNIPETAPTVSQISQTPAVQRTPVEVEPEVPRPPAVEIAPVPVPTIPEVAPVKTVPAEPELPPVETVPAPVEFSSPSEYEEAIEQVEEAFSHVTTELEGDIDILPPPPTTADDAADDWQYQLPAPPTAFRDTSSPTLTAGETIDISSAQVFVEPEDDLDRSVTRVNPLFIAQESDMNADLVEKNNESKSRNMNDNLQETARRNSETNSRNTKQLYSDNDSRENDFDHTQKTNEFKSRDENYLYGNDYQESASENHQQINETKFSNIKKPNDDDRSSRKNDLDYEQQINKLKSSKTKKLGNGNSVDYTTDSNKQSNEMNQFENYSDINNRQLLNGIKSREPSQVYDSNSRDLRRRSSEIESKEEMQNEPESRSVKQVKNVRSNELSNFTITSYQRPRVTEDIYAESSDDDRSNFVAKPTKLYLHQKFNSTTTLNNNLSRTNSFSDEAAKESTAVKRSTSQISLVLQPSSASVPSKTKSVTNLIEEGRKERESTTMKDTERERLLDLQEQFIQLQQQLLQNSSLLEKQSSSADAPLQSLQVLRSILPQLGQQPVRANVESKSLEDTQNSKVQDRETELKANGHNPKSLQERRNSKNLEITQSSKIVEDKQTSESGKQKSVVTVNNEKPPEPKRFVYRGPPAVNFTTWSERPKTQVSIKMDGDYRIGIGQSNQKETYSKTSEQEKSPYNEVDAAPPQVVSQLTVNKPVINVSETKESENPATVGLRASQHSDPSRVPIVRSVELKKSFVEQQNLHKSTTLLNGGGSVDNLATDQRFDDDRKFVGVNSLAKRFSVGVTSTNSARPVSAYGRVENTAPRKYMSVVGIGTDSDNSTAAVKKAPSVVRVNGYTAPKHLMPVVKGFQFATPAANREASGNKPQQTDSVSAGSKLQQSDSFTGNKLQRTNSASTENKLQRTDSASLQSKPQIKSACSWMKRTDLTTFTRNSRPDQPEPPPPPPVTFALKKTVTRPKTLPVEDPRDQLMDAIRNFGGRENLRQYSPTQDNIVVIR